MNVLVFNWRDIKHPLSGGAEISLFEHAKHWRKKGANVLWYCSSYKNCKLEEEIDGIRFIRRGTHHTVHLWAFIYYLKGVFGSPDVVVDCFHFIPFFTPIYMFNKKIIAFINEPAKNAWFKNIVFPLSLIGYIVEPLFFIFYRNKPFITGSESIAEELENYGIKRKNISIIHHGFSKRKNNMNKKFENPTIIFMAQLTKDKGVEDAIKGFSIFRKKYKSARLLIVGKGDKNYLSKLKRLSIDLNLKDAVKFLGFVSEDKKFELLAKSWVLIHPSIREGWGLNIIEANSVGTPTVGYDVVGLRDSIQNGKTGILVNKNSQSLSDGVEKLILDKILYEKMSKQAKTWSENFDWTKSGEKSWKVIESTISN